MDARLGSVLFRHRFQTRAQAARHLIAQEGRTWLFLPVPDDAAEAGRAAMVELAFEDLGQTRMLRGSIAARHEGRGLWLESPDTRLAAEVAGHGLSPRREQRLGADLPVELRRLSGQRELVRLHDVSPGGGHLGAVTCVLGRGVFVQIALLGPDRELEAELGGARVVWCGGGGEGFEVVEPGG